MAYLFGDGFDFYANVVNASDMGGYWDTVVPSGPASNTGRFPGSKSFGTTSNTFPVLAKNSGSNDATHHIVVAYNQTLTLSGTSQLATFTLGDGANAQCSIMFRSDGTILLMSGSNGAGTTLATYSGAITAANTWNAFEFEVTINNTAGTFTVRKNGNTSNDFAATALNTRNGSTNSYANRLSIGCFGTNWLIDDLLWFNTSGAAPNTWVGDIRCYQRMPASDAAVQLTRNIVTTTIANAINATQTRTASSVILAPFTPAYTGTISGGSISVSTAATANIKVALFDSGLNLLASAAAPIANPVAGSNAFTFTTPPAVTGGATYYLATDQDASVTYNAPSAGTPLIATTAYASFPPSSYSGLSSGNFSNTFSLSLTPNNASMVYEAQEDGTTTYVFSGTAGQNDLYNITALGVTPASIIAVTTRAYMEKSDAGARSAAVQVKSGSTTVQTATLALSSSFLWNWRTDTVDPNTSAAWSVTALNNLQIGPVVVS